MTDNELGTTMAFDPNPTHSAWIEVDLKLLRDFLRLPKDVDITGASYDGLGSLALQLAGPGVPANGELVAEYKYKQRTDVEFKGFRTLV